MTKEISSSLFSLELNTTCGKHYVPYIIGSYRVVSNGNKITYFNLGKQVTREAVVEDLMKAFERQITSRLIKGACDE